VSWRRTRPHERASLLVAQGVGVENQHNKNQGTVEVMVRTLSHVFFLDPSPVRRVPIQTGIQRKLNFVSVRTIKGRSSRNVYIVVTRLPIWDRTGPFVLDRD
jgi:hypothetical protein